MRRIFTDDELYDRARDFISGKEEFNFSKLQRYLLRGYADVARVVEMLEKEGYLSAYNSESPRKIIK
jgi:DNA segregation ATPase FtsK/SpoIIIE-like protein